MDIKELNESIEKILYEGWNSGGYNELFANIILQSEEGEERLLELASSTTSLAVLLNKLKEEKIDYYFYTILDEESFDAQSLDQLKADISGYYSEFYSNVMVSISESDIETSNEGIIIGTVYLGVDDEYEDEDD